MQRVRNWPSVAVVIGCLTAVLVILPVRHPALSGASETTGEFNSNSPPSALSEALRFQAQVDRAQVEDLERRLSKVEGGIKGTGSKDSPIPTAAESLEVHAREQENALASHDAESVRSTWSHATAAALGEGLKQLEQTSQLRVVSIDCREVSCVATVEWGNYEVASQSYGDVVIYPYGVPCGVSMFLPEPPDRSSRYLAKALFTCDVKPGVTNG